MKTDKQILYEALRGSLTSSVLAFQRNDYGHIFIKVRNQTEHGTPVFKYYRLTLTPVMSVDRN